MNASRRLLTSMTACSLFIGSALVTARTTSAPSSVAGAYDVSEKVIRALARQHLARASAAGATALPPLTLRELAQARRATAKYHDIANALADGYADGNLYTAGEGYHYINPLLIDGTFNPEQPEVLLYASRPGEDGLKLVAVEYVVPNTFSVPEGFTGDADVWQSEEPFPIWVLNAWIWLTNPSGTFTFLNPRVPSIGPLCIRRGTTRESTGRSRRGRLNDHQRAYAEGVDSGRRHGLHGDDDHPRLS